MTVLSTALGDPQILVLIVTLILAAGGGAALKALTERKSQGANATATVVAAARELVDPLRKELAEERAEHARELQVEREKVAAVRRELAAALAEAQELRAELAMARVEADELRREREADRARIRERDRRIRDLESR